MQNTDTYINVLSYNVWFKAMINNDRRKTIEDFIIESSSHPDLNNNGYDLIAIQEMTKEKFPDFFKNITSHENLKNLTAVCHEKINNSNHILYHVTLYDDKKYDLQAVKIGDITGKGRPYHILFLVHKKTNKNIIFINVHNTHNRNFTKEQIHNNIKSKLSNNLNNAIHINTLEKEENLKKESENSYYYHIPYNFFDSTSKIHSDIYDKVIKDNNFEIIMAGDFNDNHHSKIWMGITPFEYSGLSELKDIEVKSENKPPNTCCDRNIHQKKVISDGDYILSSENIKSINSNFILDIFDLNNSSKYGGSDHIPIISKYYIEHKKPSSKLSIKTPSMPFIDRNGKKLNILSSHKLNTSQWNSLFPNWDDNYLSTNDNYLIFVSSYFDIFNKMDEESTFRFVYDDWAYNKNKAVKLNISLSVLTNKIKSPNEDESNNFEDFNISFTDSNNIDVVVSKFNTNDNYGNCLFIILNRKIIDEIENNFDNKPNSYTNNNVNSPFYNFKQKDKAYHNFVINKTAKSITIENNEYILKNQTTYNKSSESDVSLIPKSDISISFYIDYIKKVLDIDNTNENFIDLSKFEDIIDNITANSNQYGGNISLKNKYLKYKYKYQFLKNTLKKNTSNY